GDLAQVQGPGDAHCCPACPHTAVGPAIIGSPDVFINGMPALRIQDNGIHAVCCGMNMWTATKGAPFVNINGKAAWRVNDMGQSCGGMNKLIQGSPNVVIGDSGGGGGGGGGGSSRAAQARAGTAGTTAAGATTGSSSSAAGPQAGPGGAAASG